MDLLNLELVTGVGAIALIVALVQIAKNMGFPTKFSPLLSIGLGLLASFGFHFYSEDPIYTTIVVGLAMGVGAVGSYSTVKNVIEGLRGTVSSD